MNPHCYAIIGTSDGALALASELRLLGRRVILSTSGTKWPAWAASLRDPGLRIDSRIETFAGGVGESLVAGLEIAHDQASAVAEADAIIMMVPPTKYEQIFAAIAGAISSDQIILLAPGGLGGSLLIQQLATRAGVPDVLVAQMASMPIGGRSQPSGELHIVSKKRRMPVGVFPANRTGELLDRLHRDFPQLGATANAIECALASAAPGLHPIPMIMNAARIEADGPYVYDSYAITPTIAHVIETVDRERQLILRGLGASPASFAELLRESYGVAGDDFYEVVRAVPSYQQVMSPADLNYRYLSEDVPTQIVPAVALAQALDVQTPTLDAVIAFTNAMHGHDYRSSGWNLAKLGLAGIEPGEIRDFLYEGPASVARRAGL